MKKTILLLLLILKILPVHAQPPHWAWNKFTAATSSTSLSIAIDSAGNSYAVGYYTSLHITFGSYTFTRPTSSYSSSFIVKYDPSGNVVWAKTGLNSGGVASSVKTDALGNVYVAGRFDDTTVTFDGTVLTSKGQTDLFIVKYNAAGTLIWAKNAGGNMAEAANAVDIDTAGNVYLTGYYKSAQFIFGSDTLFNSGSADYFTLKYDSLGNPLWLKGASGTYAEDDKGEHLAFDPNGYIYVTGAYASDSLIIGNTVLSGFTLSNASFFMAKYDLSGNLMWAESCFTDPDDKIGNIKADAAGNIYMTGTFTTHYFTLGGLAIVNSDPSSGGNTANSFVARFNSSGAAAWGVNKGYNSVGPGASNFFEGYDLALDTDQNIYVCGTYCGNVTINFGSVTLPVVNYSTGPNLVILKYDAAGSEIWAKSNPRNAIEVANTIAIHTDGSIYTSGFIGYGTFGGTYSYNMGIYKSFPGFVPVWPGDVDNNGVADNNDLLPLGLVYGQTGYSRAVIGNVWQADTSADWGPVITGYVNDVKHADCNGNGIVNSDDTLAINLNFNSLHALAPVNTPPVSQERTGFDMHFVTSSSVYNPGDIVDVEVWLGNSTNTIYSIYGIAFNILYDARLVQPGTAHLTYSAGWLGAPGVNMLTIGKIDAMANTAFGAVVRTDHTDIMSGYGKIADFKFQVSNSIDSASLFHLSFSAHNAIRSTGELVPFIPAGDSLLFNPGSSTVGINETAATGNTILISPNPSTESVLLSSTNELKNASLSITDITGKKVYTEKFSGKTIRINKGVLLPGIYFVTISSENTSVTKKLVIQ